jgi:hypothetical protein
LDLRKRYQILGWLKILFYFRGSFSDRIFVNSQLFRILVCIFLLCLFVLVHQLIRYRHLVILIYSFGICLLFIFIFLSHFLRLFLSRILANSPLINCIIKNNCLFLIELLIYICLYCYLVESIIFLKNLNPLLLLFLYFNHLYILYLLFWCFFSQLIILFIFLLVNWNLLLFYLK